MNDKERFELAKGVAPDLDHEQVRQYLNDLRHSGRVNMFGAAPWLEKEFGCTRQESKALLIGWMESYE